MRFLLDCLQTWVGSLKSTNLPFYRCHIFVSFRNNVCINFTLRQNTTVLYSYRHQQGWPCNDLECPIHLKVRLVDGTLDVRLLRVSNSTMRIGVARGSRGGVGWRASPPSMWAADALFLCGSWASCYCVVGVIFASGWILKDTYR